MRIGIDALAVDKTTDGIGRYAIELIKAFSQRNDPHQYIIFKNPSLNHSFKFDERFREKTISLRRYSLKEQLYMPRILEKEKLDIVHSLHFTLPLGYKGAQVMTVHDIMPVLFPWCFGTGSVIDSIASAYLSFLVRASLKRAAITIVDSEHTAMDLRTHYKVSSDQLSRIYLGIDHLNPSRLEYKINTVSFLGFPNPFILTVTNFRPYKNTRRLIKAFSLVNKILPDLRLVVVGDNPKYYRRTLGNLTDAEKKNVHFLGFVDDGYLTALLSSAEVFVFPSSYEGFGFPILEAMNLGTPVITSSACIYPAYNQEDPDNPKCSEEMVTINQLAEMAMKIARKKVSIKHIPGPLGVRGRNSDNKIMREKLKWEPKMKPEEGLTKTYKWICQQVEKQKKTNVY